LSCFLPCTAALFPRLTLASLARDTSVSYKCISQRSLTYTSSLQLLLTAPTCTEAAELNEYVILPAFYVYYGQILTNGRKHQCLLKYKGLFEQRCYTLPSTQRRRGQPQSSFISTYIGKFLPYKKNATLPKRSAYIYKKLPRQTKLIPFVRKSAAIFTNQNGFIGPDLPGLIHRQASFRSYRLLMLINNGRRQCLMTRACY
jgi:hypothetical protein